MAPRYTGQLWLPSDPLCISLPFIPLTYYTEVIFLMDIYFFTLVSTQIADPASGAWARVMGIVPGPAAVLVSSEPQRANFFQKHSSSLTDAALSCGGVLPERPGAACLPCPGRILGPGFP